MPEIIPFQPFVYAPKYRPVIGTLLSPPYDIVNDFRFEELKNLHPYQSIRIALAESNEDPFRYKKMADIYRTWKAESVLIRHPRSAFFLVEDRFEDQGQSRSRVGFVALLKVEPFEKKGILPHEHTLSGPKKDRFDLLHEMKAEISQIFLGYRDEELTVEKIYEGLKNTAPLFEATDTTDVHRRVWPIENLLDIKQIQNQIAKKSLLIADGHHRYETAVASREKFPWVQVYLTNLNQPGFSIRAIHRIFSLPAAISKSEMLDGLSKLFTLSGPNQDIEEPIENSESFSFNISFGPHEHYSLKRMRRNKEDAAIFSIHSDIFEKILGWNIQELKKGTVTYVNTRSEYQSELLRSPGSVGLYLPPTDLDLVMRLAAEGKRMPQKSTFFFPKLASGLFIYDLESPQN